MYKPTSTTNNTTLNEGGSSHLFGYDYMNHYSLIARPLYCTLFNYKVIGRLKLFQPTDLSKQQFIHFKINFKKKKKRIKNKLLTLRGYENFHYQKNIKWYKHANEEQ